MKSNKLMTYLLFRKIILYLWRLTLFNGAG